MALAPIITTEPNYVRKGWIASASVPTNSNLYECMVCGALTTPTGRQLHNAWHEALASALAQVSPPHAQIPTIGIGDAG